jgi:hypothetical protein
VIIVRAAKKEDHEWLTDRTGSARTPGFKAIKAVDESTGEILGMVGYDFWTAGSVGMHVAIDSMAACRKLLKVAFWYPFVSCKLQTVWAFISATNYQSRKLACHMGFAPIASIRDGVKQGEDMIVHEMRKDKCRWINDR